MNKKDSDNLKFHINSLWDNTIPKDKNTIAALTDGSKAAQTIKKTDLERVNKADLKNILEHINNQWNTSIPQNKHTIVAFIKGFDITLSPNFDLKKEHDFSYNNITKLFSIFIYREYQIHHLTWYSQVETYAYRNRVDWISAFKELYERFYNTFLPQDYENETYTEGSLYSLDQKIHFESERISIVPEFIDSITISNQKISQGTILQLGDLIGTDYKKTVHFELEVKDPSWDLYEASEKDFQHVKLCHIHQNDDSEADKKGKLECRTFHRVRRICSGFTTEVKYIVKRNSNYYVYTDNFEIEITSALEKQEVKIVYEREDIDSKRDEYFEMVFHDSVEAYEMGCLTNKEFFGPIYGGLINSEFNTPLLNWVNYKRTLGGWLKVER